MKVELNNCVYNIEQIYGASEAPTLIFLHYFGGSARTWQLVIEQLNGAAQCVAVDMRGFGESKATNNSYTLPDYAQDIAELVQKLGLTSYILVGHSMGGKVALLHAAQQPKGLQMLVLIAPSPPTPEPMTETERSQMLETHGSREAALQTIQKITAHPLPAVLLERAITDNLRSQTTAWQAWLEQGSRADITSDLTSLELPIVVIVGTADPVIPPDMVEREIVGRFKAVQLERIAEVGHLSPLEAPAQLAKIIGSVVRPPKATSIGASS